MGEKEMKSFDKCPVAEPFAEKDVAYYWKSDAVKKLGIGSRRGKK